MKKRKPCSALWEKYKALSESWNTLEATEAVEAGWRELWNQYVAPPALEQTCADDVALLCELGWRLAVVKGNHALALQRLQSFFSHPAYVQSDKVVRQYLTGEQGISLLYTGRVEEAARLYSALLDTGNRLDRSIAGSMVRNHLHTYCVKQPPKEPALSCIIEPANKVLTLHRIATRPETRAPDRLLTNIWRSDYCLLIQRLSVRRRKSERGRIYGDPRDFPAIPRWLSLSTHEDAQ